MYRFIIVYFLLQNFCAHSSAQQCVGENNEPVDWFFVYKIPKITNGGPLIKDGVGYTYITSTSPNKKWQFSNFEINSPNSIIGKTLSPHYPNPNGINSYLLYNDQPPNNTANNNRGHSKGTILFNGINEGFWLIHSVPKFPPEFATSYSYPDSGLINGQSFLCISMNLANIRNVFVQLQYIGPQIYEEYNTAGLKPLINQSSLSQNKILIQSTKNVSFDSFAKSKNFEKDLYADWVAPDLQNDFYVETWRSGSGNKLPSSNCNDLFGVFNVEEINLSVANVNFPSSKDHSKWAVSANSNWICIGDINRMESQKKRGGGTVCLNDFIIGGEYKNSVAKFEACH